MKVEKEDEKKKNKKNKIKKETKMYIMKWKIKQQHGDGKDALVNICLVRKWKAINTI